ncbi:Serine--tRNA ligase, mitochondrial [Amphibalanus amphitrite]|uniref:serine--tRNA ligase n=1 Tax=Amphibalanus amphitrite TaxID=1232801 RepID=A0A6A4VMP2_AMPAM|nr:Serine--tRNA ligase, mitochondrial [Amphibalanus amphitrite]KAF0291952.1 Serine--tRNA ligase, mitochondrial [Amphibalanus amphitrite]
MTWPLRLAALRPPGPVPAGWLGRRWWRRRCTAASAAAADSELFHPGERPAADLDWPHLLCAGNAAAIAADVQRRKGVGDVRRVQQLHAQYRAAPPAGRAELLRQLSEEALRLPNHTRPDRPGAEPQQMVPVKTVGQKPDFNFPVKDFRHRAEKLNMFRMENLGLLTGSRTYVTVAVTPLRQYLKHELAELEAALVRFALRRLLSAGFQLVSVPDLLNSSVLEACGVSVHGDRTMVYSLDESHHGDVCLSGTAEMALGALVAGRRLPADRLPLRLAAVSRCFRPEVSNLESEAGIYRVHQFTKVEMFGVCAADTAVSGALLDEFVAIQEGIFTDLGLHFIVYDMPPHELGAPAYRKYDIEAWMPGRRMYGEVSSASDCTDYQSRRLAVRDCAGRRLHTVNGTACAAPRTLLALVETGQQRDGTVAVPPALRPLLGGREVLRPRAGRAQWLKGHQLRLAAD